MKQRNTWRRVLSWEVDIPPERIKRWLIQIMQTAAETAEDDYDCHLLWEIDDNNIVSAEFYSQEDPSMKRKYIIQDGGNHNGNNMISVQEEGDKVFHITAIPTHLVAIMYAA